MATQQCAIQLWLRQCFHPAVFAVIALVLAVAGSGYGYKLSQYLHHSGVSKASLTRMWVDHRDETVVLPANHVKPQRIPGLALFAFAAPQVPRFARDHVIITPAPLRAARIICAHIPFRAPPSLHPSFA